MTTLIVVAVDDFSIKMESNDPDVPPYLLQVAEYTQANVRRHERTIARAMIDAVIFGHGEVEITP